MSSTDSTSFAGAEFRSTAWSIIRGAQNPQSPEYRRSLERLMRVYWKPIYWTIRVDWNENRENARDLTQEYLAMFLEKDLFGQVSQSRGRFRAFIKATLKNFLLSIRREGAAKKRGGSVALISLGNDDIDRAEAHDQSARQSPEKLFDRELLRAVMEEELAELEREMKAEGREAELDLFLRHYYGGVPYQALAAERGLSQSDVNNRLYEVRRRFRRRVIDRLRDGVSSEEDLAAEVRELLAGS